MQTTMTKLPTMTLHECAEGFRANQIPITEALLCAGIDQGKFPFAVGLGNVHRAPLIFRESFYTWLGEMMQKPAIRAYEEATNSDA